MTWVRQLESAYAGTRVAPYSVSFFGVAALTVQPVHLISVEPQSNGFVCRYSIAVKNDFWNLIKQQAGSDSTFPVVHGFLQILSAFTKDVRVDQFELGDHGWWSPTLRETFAKNQGLNFH
jgi:hypothetical protein